MFIRPTILGDAMLRAALKAGAQNKIAATAIELIRQKDRYKNVMVSGYNRTEIDGVRVSQETLDKLWIK
jgi:hypothetical protein